MIKFSESIWQCSQRSEQHLHKTSDRQPHVENKNCSQSRPGCFTAQATE